MSIAASASTMDEAWHRLRHHLDWSDRFWLGFIFTSSAEVEHELRERTSWNRKLHAQRFVDLEPHEPSELAGLLDAVEHGAALPRGCTWINVSGTDSRLQREWESAWTWFLQDLNHRRDTLRSRLGGIVIVADPFVKQIAQHVSTDVWSIRDYLAEVHADPSIGGALGTPHIELASPRSDVVDDSRRTTTGLVFKGRRSEQDQTALSGMLAAGNNDVRHRLQAKIASAIQHARQVGDTEAATMLLLRRADAAAADRDLAAAQGDYDDAATLDAPIQLTIRALDASGRIARQAGQWDAAETSYTRSLKLAEQLAEQIGGPGELRDLSVSLNNLGAVQQARGQWGAAETSYTRSLKIVEGLGNSILDARAYDELVAAIRIRLAVVRKHAPAG